MTSTCATCGVSFEWVKSPSGGRPPVQCPAHRKKRGSPDSSTAVNARRRARRAVAGAAADDPFVARMLAARDEARDDLVSGSTTAAARVMSLSAALAGYQLMGALAAGTVAPAALAGVIRQCTAARVDLLGDESAKAPYSTLNVIFHAEPIENNGACEPAPESAASS